MYEHVKRLAAVSFYSAPSDRRITPVQIPEHTELVELITGGRVFFEQDGTEAVFGRGAMFWHESGEWTVHRTPEEDPYRCAVFKFEVDLPCRPAGRVTVWKQPEAAVEFGAEMLAAFHEQRYDRQALTAYVYAALAWRALNAGPVVKALYPKPLRRILQYMEEHYTEMLSAEVLAAAGGVSRPYLFALFREHLHSSPHRWLLRKRLNRARLLLAGGEEPVKFIAAECGFESLEVFYRQFRQNVGIPPAEYRRRYRPYPVS